MDERIKQALTSLRNASELYGRTKDVSMLVFFLTDLSALLSLCKRMEDVPKEVIAGIETNKLIIIDRIVEIQEELHCG